MQLTLWTSARRARELGCTHHARFLGIIPGFFDPGQALWVARSDLLAPLEDVLSVIWAACCEAHGEESEFMLTIGRPIEGETA